MREGTPRNESRPEEPEYAAVQGKGTVALGDATDVLAAVPGRLESFSSSMHPALRACLVESGAERLRSAGRRESHAVLHFPDHLDWLLRAGFTREDIRQVRYVVEAFYNVEPIHALLTACALEWVAGRNTAAEVSGERQCPGRVSTVVDGRIELVDDCNPPGCLLQFVGRWERPCHSLFRALAVWPGYLARVGDDIERFVKADAYTLAVETLRETARRLCGKMPVLGRTTDLNADCDDLGDTLDRCLSLSCEVILICSSLRRMFVNAERGARSRGA